MIRARHDPYSFLDRFPQGACPAGSVVCLRLTSPDAPRSVWVRLWRGGGEEFGDDEPIPADYGLDEETPRRRGGDEEFGDDDPIPADYGLND